MKIKLNYLLLLIFINLSFGQNSATIKGNVFSKTDNLPLQMVNIYLVGTTIGTTSNEKGEFEIKNVPAGNHEIIFSMIGFEPVNKFYTISADKKHEIGSISMKEKTYITEEVAVEAREDSDWQFNFEIFNKIFLGRTAFTKECEITNKFYINFQEKDGKLIAKVDRPLNIINNALGYEISCEIYSFEYNFTDESYRYVIKKFFKNLPPQNAFDESKWDANRRIAYQGSEHHFFKSFLQNNLSNEWSVAKIERPKENYVHKRIATYNNNSSFLEFQDLNNNYKFSFDGFLEIVYKPRNLISVIQLMSPSVTLNFDGYFNEITTYSTFGYWSQLGLANMLPKYSDVIN